METKEIRREARQTYKFAKLGLCSAFLILLLVTLGLISIKSTILAIFSGIVYKLMSLAFDIIILAVLSPFVVGLYEWGIKLCSGKMLPVSGMFNRFSSFWDILDSQRIFFSMFSCVSVTSIPALSAVFLIINAPTKDIYGFIFLLVIACLLSLFLLCSVFPIMYILVSMPQTVLKKAIFLSFSAMKGHYTSLCKLLFEYLLWILLSLLTFGGLLFIFTMPYIFCSMVIFCNAVFEEREIYKHNLYY